MALSALDLDVSTVGFHNGARNAEPNPEPFTLDTQQAPDKSVEDPFLFLWSRPIPVSATRRTAQAPSWCSAENDARRRGCI